MFQRIMFGTMAALVVPVLAMAAEPKDDLKSAVKKLTDSPNYSWTTKVEGGIAASTIEGKTEKDGPTSLSLKMRDNSYDVVIQGDKAAVKTADGWKSVADMAKSDGGGAGGFNPERYVAMIVQNYKTPTAQANELCSKLDNLQKSGDAYTADLSPEAAKQLLALRRPGGANAPQIEVADAKGSLKCWVTDGALAKAEVHLQGTVSFNGNSRDIDRTTTTEIKDVGSTKVAVPDEAKAKL